MVKRNDKNIKIQKNFYNNRPWRRVRKEVLLRDNKECQWCKQRGKFSRATTVHHIKHYERYPELGLNHDNLISLCRECHEGIHDREFGVSKKSEIHKEKWG